MNKDEIRDMAIIISGSTELDTMSYYSARYKAKALIDAGYRKIEDDEIVIKKRQYEQLKKHNRDRKRLRLKWQQAKQELEQAKKETASEVSKNILTKLADDFSGLDGMEVEYPLNKVKELAKQLSVEI